MLIGTAIGVPVGIATHASIIGLIAVVGLLIGFVVSQGGKNSPKQPSTQNEICEQRLKRLDELHEKPLISDEEYAESRKDIISSL